MSDSREWPLGTGRELRPGQRAEVWIAGVDGRPAELVYTSDTVLLEAPNWAPDDHALLLNGHGRLWRLDLGPPAALTQVVFDGLPPINNDHVVDAGRRLIYLSANDGHIWVAPLAGGTPTRVTHDPSRYHFLHGASPDGASRAFVDLRAATSPPPAASRSSRRRAERRRIPRRGAGTWTAPSTRRTARGCTSTPRRSRSGPATPNSPACRRPAGASSGWSSRTPSTGSHTCLPTRSSPPT